MDLSVFMNKTLCEHPDTDFYVSSRFDKDGEPTFFKIKAISEMENQELRRSCMTHKKGELLPSVDYDKYIELLVTTCCVCPDFNDAALQKFHGCMGAQDLVKKMLLPGEYIKLANKIKQVCGFDRSESQLKQELKNA